MSVASRGTSGLNLAADLAALDNNIYGLLHNSSHLDTLARGFANVGWRTRTSAREEYEVECTWCQLNLFNSGGMSKFAGVVDWACAEDLAAIFRSLDIDYEIELYDAAGELARTLLPGTDSADAATGAP